jgi:hypothetical protein
LPVRRSTTDAGSRVAGTAGPRPSAVQWARVQERTAPSDDRHANFSLPCRAPAAMLARVPSARSATPNAGASPLARQPNYDFEKRRKELERKTKKEEKLRRKRENAAQSREESGEPISDDESAAPPE